MAKSCLRIAWSYRKSRIRAAPSAEAQGSNCGELSRNQDAGAPSDEERSRARVRSPKSPNPTKGNTVKQIMTARNAILAELKRRAMENDPNVKPVDVANEHRWHKPQDNYYTGSGEMVCPVCQTGRLRYSRANYNGHVHAACSTTGCVRWME